MMNGGGDTDWLPVDQYERKVRRHLPDGSVSQTTSPDRNIRRLAMNEWCYPEPVDEVFVTVEFDPSDSDTEAMNADPDARQRAETHIHYQEEWDNREWAARWGRHKNSHNTFEHFHYPPDAARNPDPPAYDADYPDGLLLVEIVAEFVTNRMNDIGSKESLTFPKQYTWDGDYWPNQRIPPC